MQRLQSKAIKKVTLYFDGLLNISNIAPTVTIRGRVRVSRIS